MPEQTTFKEEISVEKIAVGVVVYRDGAFQVGDIQVRMRHTP